MQIPKDNFIGSHYISWQELITSSKVIMSKSLFRHDGFKLLHKSDQLEHAICEFLGVKYCVAVSSGTAALKMALLSNHIGPGDEVLVPCFTFVATANVVLSCGAIPVMVEIDESFGMDVTDIENKITSKTKAILAVHLQGSAANIFKIKRVAEKHNLRLIEDAAQAFGAKIKDKYLGTIGSAGIFSLQAGKIITCGEGGLFVTNDKQQYELAKMYADSGGYRDGDNYPTWTNGKTIYGENFKITELQSAVALEQLKKINKIIKRQKLIKKRLINDIVSKYKVRVIYDEAGEVPVSIGIIFNTKSKAEKLVEAMNNVGISFSFKNNNYICNYDTFVKSNSPYEHQYPYQNYRVNKCLKSKNLIARTVWLPLSPNLNRMHCQYIIKQLEVYHNA